MQVPRQVRKYVSSSDENVFIAARDFFHRNKDIRHHKVVAYREDGNVAYSWASRRTSR